MISRYLSAWKIMSKYPYLFLLGGPDLEMEAIGELLKQHGYVCLDAGLGWGNASVTAYEGSKHAEEIQQASEQGITIVGIELKGKPALWQNYVLIDHHNENEDKPSSLEQVANLLDITLNRAQQLIAANDSGYIPALREIGASEEEIRDIRKRDRQAQGITEEDERLAKKSIDENLTAEGITTVVRALTSHFSSVGDRLAWHQSLLIYNEKKLVYYGRHRDVLIQAFSEHLKTEKAYHGGGIRGFFGFDEKAFSTREIQDLKRRVLKCINTAEEKKKLLSHHVFMFAFKWEHAGVKEFQEKFDLKTTWGDSFGKWKREKLHLGFDEYNEYNYFHPHVREILYDLGEDLQTIDNAQNEALIKHYEYPLPLRPNRPQYCIKYKNKGAETTYRLEIDSIHLNLYGTGTGCLSIHLRNFDHPHPEDILKINQFGRRLFPPFMSLDKQSVITGESNKNSGNSLLEYTKNSELSEATWIEGLPDTSSSYEDFNQYLNKDTFKHGPFQLPQFIKCLFPKDFFFVHRKDVPPSPHRATAFKVYLRPVVDDRMFVVCWYGNGHLTNKLKAYSKKKEQYSFLNNKWWYRYILIDSGGAMVQNMDLLPQLLEVHTYARWVDLGTLYGMSRYSMVMLTGELTEAQSYAGVPSFLVAHLQTMYYKMAELCLIQRATVLSYADEVTHVSDLTKDKGENRASILKRIKELYGRYILFVNKIYFREITAQEQGIEMYDLLQKQMNLKEEVKDLDQEIEELQNYAKLTAEGIRQEKEKETNKLLKNLTVLSVIFLPFAFLLSVVDMGTVPETFYLSGKIHWPFWYRFIIIVLGGVFIIIVLKRFMGLGLQGNTKKTSRTLKKNKDQHHV